ncbi:hypothetical protein BGZ61DRAFT_41692 [Ilyonectria robusta]|uniref:uncharacterized protein n=1 Tax=Ilyonectria robusta TaxID=1079257 RepID=UPI001E8DE269|nr:uncharacterized protein BGZ61DRAFT_41692 [Ilyonectria robusta]KAH8688370.1 hypothetical protein BGZ61DRAFT_41692 [Ilyonectria robusta]
MTGITSLPCEIVVSIFRNLDDVRCISSVLLTCRYFYACYNERPSIGAEILRRRIPSALLPYSVALIEASRHPFLPAVGAVLQLLHDLYEHPDQMANKLHSLPISGLLELGHIHVIIDTLVNDFATDAWKLLCQEAEDFPTSVSLSSTEYLRFCRAFYRAELFFRVYRGANQTTLERIGGAEARLFFSRVAPWENEQLGCVYDFLDKRFSHAARDVLAHDVEFGEYNIDYLSIGSENEWTQCSISRGLSFVHQVMNEKSYDSKMALLKPIFFGNIYLLLHNALSACSAEFCDNLGIWEGTLEEISDEEMELLIERSIRQDTDHGPFSAWHSEYKYISRNSWVMAEFKAGLRERAYVLWDNDRMDHLGMLDLYEFAPEDPSHMCHHEEEYSKMQKSFEERSQIYRQGGRGYWSPNDTSRIEWLSSNQLNENE